MTAEEARSITVEARSAKSGLATQAIKEACQRIKYAASKGRWLVIDPVATNDREIKDLAYLALQQPPQSFKVVHHSSQKDGDTYEVSWGPPADA